MPGRILTDVSATVDPNRGDELAANFRELGSSPLPDGLLRTELLRGPEGRWRIQTLWRDREALDAMLAHSATPVARRLFQEVGADSTLQIFEVDADHLAP